MKCKWIILNVNEKRNDKIRLETINGGIYRNTNNNVM